MLLEDAAGQLIVKPDHLIQQLRVLDVVRLLVAVVGQRARHHLFVSDVLEVQKLALILVLLVVEVLPSVGGLRKEAGLARNRGAVGGRGRGA